MGDEPQENLVPDEREALVWFLDFLRGAVLRKAENLGDEDLRRALVPSGTTVLGLVKHLAYVERSWFRDTFAAEEDLHLPWTKEDPDADLRIEPHETTEEIFALYRDEIDRSRTIVAASHLDDMAGRARSPMNLRWIVVHMIEETGRHAGHIDILRELLDGTTGE